jgi:hypothetical protein
MKIPHLLVLAVAWGAAAPAPAMFQSPAHTFDDLNDLCISVGDVDGDGRPDLAVARAGHASITGRVELRSGASGATLFVLQTGVPGDGFGMALERVPDLDGDGRDEIAIGIPLAAPPRVTVHSGSDGTVLRTIPAPVGGPFGTYLASGGDCDGDGVAELLVSSPPTTTTGPGGEAVLFSLASGAVVRTHAAVGPIYAVAFVGDVDGDGMDDYALGVPVGPSTSFTGLVEVRSGFGGGLAYRIIGDSAESALGVTIESIADLDGDAVPELLVGAPAEFSQSSKGALHVCSGADGTLLRHHTPSLPGFWMWFGASACSIGDQNGDGFEEYAVLARQKIVIDLLYEGRVFFYDGATGAATGDWSPLGQLGPLASLGDLNLDGKTDLALSSLWVTDFGSSLVLLGDAPAPTTYCTPKITSAGCVPQQAGSGAASLSVGAGVSIKATQLPPATAGILMWGEAPAALPFAQGTLCIAPPFLRVPAPTSAGAGACGGVQSTVLDGAYLAGHGVVAGEDVYAQGWARDTGFTTPNDVALTAGVRFLALP